MSIIKELREIRSLIRGDFYRKSFSQDGEDMVLRRFIGDRSDCFYRKGWSGINIDAMPGSMKRFKCYRPRDINLEFAI